MIEKSGSGTGLSPRPGGGARTQSGVDAVGASARFVHPADMMTAHAAAARNTARRDLIMASWRPDLATRTLSRLLTRAGAVGLFPP